jgi:hypothetical protein
MPDGTCMDDTEMPTGMPMSSGTPWWGVLAVEGSWSGDGRQFAPGALEWAPPPLPALWQPEQEGGHDGAVIVARVDGIARLANQVIGWGVLDDQGEYGAEALRLVQGGFLQGLSVSADDTDASDVELVWPAGAETVDEPLMLMALDGEVGMPEPAGLPTTPPPQPREIYHKGRIRSVTLVAEPAFVDCVIHLGSPPPEVLTAAAVSTHSTATSTGSWDGPANEKRLPSPLPVEKARAAYAWIDDDSITDGQVTKEHARFLHHEVSADGSVGAANLTACSTGIGVLNGGRGGTIIPPDGKRGVYDHLAAHLRDADREPPPLEAATGPTAVTAAGYTITIPEVWPETWFDRPTEMPPFGALHITSQGRVYGYLGPDRVTHRAFRASGRAVTIPRRVDYSEFMNKPCLVADPAGQAYRINAGNITFDCSHPSPSDPRRSDPRWAIQHYDNTCSIAARVRVGEDEHGTWVAGALLHGIDADAVERMMACALSGDWQDGKLNAALLVPVEGFPTAVQGTMRVVDGAVVASMTPVRFATNRPASDLRPVLERLARSIGRDSGTRFAQLRQRIAKGR